jgi:hypothetical protein
VKTMEPLYSTKEVAERLGFSVDWVRRTFRKRKGVVRVSGKDLRIPESVLANFIQEAANGSRNKTDDKRNRARA